jgi:hypothetical protein
LIYLDVFIILTQDLFAYRLLIPAIFGIHRLFGSGMRKNPLLSEPAVSGKSFFPWKYAITLFITLILCLIDGGLTIFLVNKGAWEANPLMRHALSVSHEYFLVLKYFLTAGGFLFLLRHGRRRIFRGIMTIEELAGGIVLFYAGLVIYEITIYHIVK